jgi:protein-S-isoprenylcysteine O-methyltransferase Ste14
MSKTKFLLVVALVVCLGILVGFILPFLFSAKSTFAVALGVLIVLGGVAYASWCMAAFLNDMDDSK